MRRRDKGAALAGLIVLAAVTAAAILAPMLSPADPLKNDLLERLTPPMWNAGGSAAHPLGTDTLGRDVLSRLLYGARLSLVVGFVTVIISGAAGVALGVIGGFYGGWLDDVLMRAGDVQLAFPVLLLGVALLSVLGPGFGNLILVLVVSGWITYARIVRGETLSLKHREFVEAARALGALDGRLIPPAPQCVGAHRGGGDLFRGAHHHRRGLPVISGPGCPRADAELGGHAG
jgi:peptide/nickel transport system permease protein